MCTLTESFERNPKRKKKSVEEGYESPKLEFREKTQRWPKALGNITATPQKSSASVESLMWWTKGGLKNISAAEENGEKTAAPTNQTTVINNFHCILASTNNKIPDNFEVRYSELVVDFFVRIFVKDHLFHEGITEHLLSEILRTLGDLFLGFGGVYLRGRLNLNLGPGGLRDSQGPPQDPVNSYEEPVIRMRKVSRFPPMREA